MAFYSRGKNMNIETRKKIAASLRSAAAKLLANKDPKELAKRAFDAFDKRHDWQSECDKQTTYGCAKEYYTTGYEDGYLAGLRDGKSEANLNR
jgi:hypothetical protein